MQVRYCVKFKPKTGHLVLRLTDDTTVSLATAMDRRVEASPCSVVSPVRIPFVVWQTNVHRPLPAINTSHPSSPSGEMFVFADHQCIMYKTFSAIILNRFEALNNRLLSQISNTKSRTRLLAPGPTARDRGASVSPGAEEDDPMSGTGLGTPARVGTPAPPTNAPNAQTPNQGAKGGGGAGGAGGAGKKKKKGKK